MEGKKGLVLGLSNERGIAWGIVKELHKHGAEFAFNYIPVMEKRMRPLAEQVGSDIIVEADVSNDEQMETLFKEIEKKWGKLDFLVHAVAFSNKEELKGMYVNTTRSNFKTTMDISVYSFTDAMRRAYPLMKDGGSAIALTYYGGEKAILNYNVMGVAKSALDASVRYLAGDLGPKNIRVNAISAGPIKTLSAAGISGLSLMEKWNEMNSPLRRNTTIEDVGKSAVFMLSDLGQGVTGEILHVDGGFNSQGLISVDAAEKLKETL
jgi:enoyl-[acyl-carrier protein] reductase I